MNRESLDITLKPTQAWYILHDMGTIQRRRWGPLCVVLEFCMQIGGLDPPEVDPNHTQEPQPLLPSKLTPTHTQDLLWRAGWCSKQILRLISSFLQ